MAFQIVINLIIAVMWMFLSESYTTSSFIAGYMLGILLLLLLNRFIPDRFYLKRVWKIMKLFLLFIRELISSNIDIVKLVYKRNPEFEPGIFAMQTDLKSDWQITLLANLISLTPGTLSIAVSDDNTYLYIHAMDIDDINDSIRDIKNTFEKAISEVTK
ncbi:Na+/H+ antiporter subunit E [Lentibacillus cibarius]|uniref:Na+/H+ antiporter subunit E n=1 Tax=Lentibacillus cibarius TaxID=2583219 RepID=A0A5S3QH16_9BACI|nr:Na+/H+ antiporter subunit E [Lentibacillus cibarius]TMN21029.1 Na+/H+ antiporter subunit E [Lentibacillus cibarius]